MIVGDPVSPELALIDPELRQWALIIEAIEAPPFERSLPPLAELRPSERRRRRIPVGAAVVYAAVRLLQVFVVGAVATLALVALIAILLY